MNKSQFNFKDLIKVISDMEKTSGKNLEWLDGLPGRTKNKGKNILHFVFYLKN